MNKRLILLFSLAFSATAFAQTGINTKNPNASLEVVATTDNTKPDGIISPKVTKATLITKSGVYAIPQTSAIVYVTDASAASADAKFTNIDAIGYYYFDGTIWQKMDYSVKKWDLNGNTITDGQFLGTLNAKALQFKYNNTNAGFLNPDNTSYGVDALPFTATGTGNVAIGTQVLKANTTGERNVAIGNSALVSNVSGFANIGIGYNALNANVQSNSNIGIGLNALSKNEGPNSNNNTAIGTNALANNTVNGNNTAIGSAALMSNAQGNQNTAIGTEALMSNIGSNSSTAVGRGALKVSTTASNTAVGKDALVALATGTFNTAIGNSAGSKAVGGSSNTFLGQGADMLPPTPPTVFSNVTAIGSGAIVGANYSTAIGAGSLATQINSIVLGRSTATGNTDKIGIGVTAPTNALHIKSATNPLKIEGVQNAPIGTYAYLVLGSDGVVYKTSGTTYVQSAGLLTPNDETTLLATIAKQAEQIKLLTESLAELKSTVNALSPIYTAQSNNK